MTRRSLWIGIPVALLAVAALYYAVDPSHSVWVPRCPFHALTGLDCPACGGQRALHSLLHGEVAEALRFNPFLVISVPYFLVVAWTSFDKGRVARHVRPVVQHRQVAYGYCLLFVVWWVVRNLPGVTG